MHRLSPLGRERTLVLTGPSAMYLIPGRPDALEAALHAAAELSGWVTAHRRLLSALVALGRREVAAAEAWQNRRPAPRTVPVLPDLIRRHCAEPAAAEARISASLMAGLPE